MIPPPLIKPLILILLFFNKRGNPFIKSSKGVYVVSFKISISTEPIEFSILEKPRIDPWVIYTILIFRFRYKRRVLGYFLPPSYLPL